MRALVMLVPAMFLACDKEPDRDELLADAQAAMPAWDAAHLQSELAVATVQCTEGDLALLGDTWACNAEAAVAEACGDDGACYAELSADCDLPGDFTETCIEKYADTTADEEEGLSNDECRFHQAAIELVAAADAGTAEEIEAALPEGYTFFEAGTTYTSKDGVMAYMALEGITSFEDSCWVVFQGSDDPEDYFVDSFGDTLDDCLLNDGTDLGECSQGMLSLYRAFGGSGLYAKVRFAVETSSDGCEVGLHIVGHGRGAAMAQLLAAELVTRAPEIYGDPEFMDLTTFGSPRVFDATSAASYDASITASRWMSWGDPVPALPASGYGHFGTTRELYIPWYGVVEHYVEPTDRDSYGAVDGNHLVGNYQERLADCF